jgi:hypothetical protein
MFRLNSTMRAWIATAALGAGAAFAQTRPQEAPSIIVDAAKNEVKNGKIVEIYLDNEISTAEVYRVIMDTPDLNRRLTIRSDGVVLHNERLYEPISYYRLAVR